MGFQCYGKMTRQSALPELQAMPKSLFFLKAAPTTNDVSIGIRQGPASHWQSAWNALRSSRE
jgi:hypothetical protein